MGKVQALAKSSFINESIKLFHEICQLKHLPKKGFQSNDLMKA